MSNVAWLILIAAALGTATLSGVLGMGGGMTLLGVMTALLPAQQVVPLHGVVQLTSNSTRTLALLGHVRWKLFALYAPFLLVGVGAATAIWSGDRLAWFKPGIGAFLLVFLLWRRFQPELRTLPYWTYAPLGVVTGFLSVFVGATGPFIAPFFLRDDLDKEEIIATKAACQSFGHFLKVPAFLYLGFDFLAHVPLLGSLIVAVVIGTLFGRWILGRISERVFVALFEGVLSLIAVWLVAGYFFG
jgi:uncharacterized membrane protein YfcA